MPVKHFTILDVQAVSWGRLALTYADGERFEVDVAPIVQKIASLNAVLQIPELFNSASLGPWGGSVRWGNDDAMELAADNLRARAIEQAGGYSHEQLNGWLASAGLSHTVVASMLGVSLAKLEVYCSGQASVPPAVAHMCLSRRNVAS